MKKRNLGYKIIAAVSTLALWLCPLGYADEAVLQFKGEFISVAEDAIISAPNISAVDIYSVKWLQLSLDELLSFMHIEDDKDEMFVGQSLYDSEGGAYQTMVAEGSSENYGISLPTYRRILSFTIRRPKSVKCRLRFL